MTKTTPGHVEDVPRGRHMLRESAGLEDEWTQCVDAHPQNDSPGIRNIFKSRARNGQIRLNEES